MERGREEKSLACSDISFWEIAMLFASKRLVKPVPPARFMHDLVSALTLEVLRVTPDIAALSQSNHFPHRDPADRLIGATAMHYCAPLITSDRRLRSVDTLETIW
jgi:PIN domain nuclease of toxin-antitoxin system